MEDSCTVLFKILRHHFSEETGKNRKIGHLEYLFCWIKIEIQILFLKYYARSDLYIRSLDI